MSKISNTLHQVVLITQTTDANLFHLSTEPHETLPFSMTRYMKQ